RMRGDSERSNGITQSRPRSSTRTGVRNFQWELSKSAPDSSPAHSTQRSLWTGIPFIPPALDRCAIARIDIGSEQEQSAEGSKRGDAVNADEQPDIVKIELGYHHADEAQSEDSIEGETVQDPGSDQQHSITRHEDRNGRA